jgi:penicillin-binding protein 1C
MIRWRPRLRLAGAVLGTAAVVLALATWAGMGSLPLSLDTVALKAQYPQVVDRNGVPLNFTFRNRWNVYDAVPLHDIPQVLRHAVVISEDKRFFHHYGVDYLARLHALWQDLTELHVVRGASTITEQVVRILHPRPRTFWSRWLEGFEAHELEQRFSKAAILEFYLNQIPYARNRRGVAQAARLYFDRELSTLNTREMLALVVLLRAPSHYDLDRNAHKIARPVQQLARRMAKAGLLSQEDVAGITSGKFELATRKLDVHAEHFVRYAKYLDGIRADRRGRLHTTLDAELQQKVQDIVDRRVHDLAGRAVTDAAALVVDHQRNEILAWVNAGRFDARTPGSQIDAVITPRQPGSALKPFLYAMALEDGWTAATLIDDSPLAQAVGHGLHEFHNYSRRHYGPVPLRDALGNSLNIPAIVTMEFVGRDRFLQRLRALHFTSLTRHPDWYGDGLALGNGAVTLRELVGAYATLARGGLYEPLTAIQNAPGDERAPQRVYSQEVTSLIANILSDPGARTLEFGRGQLLRFPVQTAIKTGTSSDYRDAWAVGFSHRYTVGVWMGNLDERPMQDVTGSIGPALAVRSVFAELNRFTSSQPLLLSRKLQKVAICRATGERARGSCQTRDEWFRPGHVPPPLQARSTSPNTRRVAQGNVRESPQLLQPTPGLQLAMDPRIPDNMEKFPIEVAHDLPARRVVWIVDGRARARTGSGTHEYLWPLSRGTHVAHARIWLADDKTPVDTPKVRFYVK